MSSSSPSLEPDPGTPPGPTRELQLKLKLATHPVYPSPSTHPITCPPSTSVLHLKELLHIGWDGKPKPEGITIIKGGRVCRDTELIEDVFKDELDAQPPPDLVLHVVVRASAWSAPFTSSPPAIEAPTPPLPTINTIPPSPLPSPPKDNEVNVEPDHEPSARQAGYSPSYISPVPSTSTPPSADARPSSSSAAVSAPSLAAQPPVNNPYLIYLNHLQRLIPIQRSLLLLNLQKAHHYYQHQVQERSARLHRVDGDEAATNETATIEELAEVESLLKECGLWALVQDREGKAVESYRSQQEEAARGGEGEFKVVQLDGLPYLLHTPASLHQRRVKPSVNDLKSVARAESIVKILTTMLQLLITFQPTSPSVAHGRALLSRAVAPSGNPIAAGREDLAVLAAAGALRPPQHQQQPGEAFLPNLGAHQHHHRAPRRAATISITLHLDSLVQFLLPLFFLSLKLAFLLFVFARHASPTKRYVLIGMAVLWVLWEGVRIARRRRPFAPGAAPPAGARGGGRDRERERERERERDRDRLRAGRNGEVRPEAFGAAQDRAQAPRHGHDGPAPPPPEAPVDQRRAEPEARAGRDVVARPAARSSSHSTSRRDPPSIFSPKYWINSLAAVGLVAEARELGLSPRYIAGRPISVPNRPFVPLERLSRWERRKIELRRLTRIAWVGFVLFFATLVPEIERKRKKALEKRDRLLAEKKVRWEKEREKEERERERRNLAQAARPAPVEKRNAEGSNDAAKIGREKVNDKELFQDGGSEAFALGPATTSASQQVNSPSSGSTSAAIPSELDRTAQPSSSGSSSGPLNSSSTPVPAAEGDTNIEEDPEDEGDGDIAASASVSDTSDDDAGPRARDDPQGADEGADEPRGGGDGAVVAIF